MIDIQHFNEIRESEHLIVLDTNILLELYRQPANISMDVINALEQILDNIYIPRQVYDEYIRNHRKICGDEKKKYRKVSRELTDSINKTQEDIGNKTSEYRKHNYTDVTKLQSELNKKIADMQTIVKEYEENHKEEIKLNIDFLENDKVKQFVDLLLERGCVGKKMKFSDRLLILQEGKVRFENLIPPGYMDVKKDGTDKYGDLFVWKNIISVAKEKSVNIVFVCNDTKEDWWEKDIDSLLELRQELLEEFAEINPTLQVCALTLEKFFAYISEELKVGKSKSALQLSSMEDAEMILNKYEDTIYAYIEEHLCSIDIEEELEEEYIETGEEYIYWNIQSVSVEKEEKNIIYFIDLDISVLVDAIYQEPGDYPYSAGKIALALNGNIELVTEEYSQMHDFKNWNIENHAIYHIGPEIWKTVKNICKNSSCREIIAVSKSLEQYQEEVRKFRNGISHLGESLQQTFQQNIEVYDNIAKVLNNMKILKNSPDVLDSLGTIYKMMEPLQFNISNNDYESIAHAIEPFAKFAELAKKAESKKADIIEEKVETKITEEEDE